MKERNGWPGSFILSLFFYHPCKPYPLSSAMESYILWPKYLMDVKINNPFKNEKNDSPSTYTKIMFQHQNNWFNWLTLAEWLFWKFRILNQEQMKFLMQIECQRYWIFCWFNSKFKVAKKGCTNCVYTMHNGTYPVKRSHLRFAYLSIIHEMFFPCF